jgi:hypothetical protein
MKKITILISVVNLVGMLVYMAFVLSTRQQAVMEERDYYEFGDSLNYILMMYPIFLLCLLSGVVWGITALATILRQRDYKPAVAWAIVAALWAVVIPVAKEMAYLPPNKSTDPAPVTRSGG